MILSATEAAAYLRRRDLLTDRAFVDGSVSIDDVSRRNRNISVRSTTGPSYFLKQGIDAEAKASVACEATVYEVLLHSPFAPYAAGPASYDAEAGVLITALLAAENLEQHYLRAGRLSLSAAGAIGRALATLHSIEIEHLDASRYESLSRPPAWALTLHHLRLDDLRNLSPGHIEVVRLVQRYANLGDAFDALSAAWRRDALCHFDLKWENVLVARGPGRFGRRIKFVDWEAAGIGDPAWDVACMLASWLAFWVRSMSFTGHDPTSRLPAQARYPLDDMYDAIRSFWAGYTGVVGEAAAQDLLPRVIAYIPSRLSEEAVSESLLAMTASGRARLLVQLAVNISLRPDQARTLLGLDHTSL